MHDVMAGARLLIQLLLMTPLGALRVGGHRGSQRQLRGSATPFQRGSATTFGLLLANHAAAARAASVSYDFGYRLERSIDPEKRGPASDDAEGGMDLLMAMCNPPSLEESATEPAASAPPATSISAPLITVPTGSTAKAGAAAGAAAAAAAPADPASSAEPLFGSVAQLLGDAHGDLAGSWLLDCWTLLS